ncbi:uncharacterized protein BJ212DRAFT_1349775, partial [Suillus subaureus]
VIWVQLSHTLHKAVTHFFQDTYNVNQHLSCYFLDPLSFCSLQAQTGLIISGSNALQFLDCTFYPKSDLDIYSHPGHIYEVLEWIKILDPPQEEEEVCLAQYSNIAEVYTFKWFVVIDREHVEFWIQVIQTTYNPIDTIMKYHSTCVMNIITFYAVYSFYPIATFKDRSALKIPGLRHHPDVLAKYIKRGWRAYSVFRPDTSGSMPCTTLSPSSEQFSWDPSTQNHWTMLTEPSTLTSLSVPNMDTKLIVTTIFYYNYLVPSNLFSLAIHEWVHDWTWFDAEIPRFHELE